MTRLSKEQTDSIRKSYLNIMAMFQSQDQVPGRYLFCLLLWATELGLNPEDIRKVRSEASLSKQSIPSGKLERIEAMYHLVHMICMDQVVEDVELEIASMYAEKLGFSSSLVSDLLKSIVTAETDGTPTADVRRQVIDFMNLHGEPS
jgi:hypothetical protein